MFVFLLSLYVLNYRLHSLCRDKFYIYSPPWPIDLNHSDIVFLQTQLCVYPFMYIEGGYPRASHVKNTDYLILSFSHCHVMCRKYLTHSLSLSEVYIQTYTRTQNDTPHIQHVHYKSTSLYHCLQQTESNQRPFDL